MKNLITITSLVAAATMTSTAFAAGNADIILINFASGKESNTHSVTDTTNSTFVDVYTGTKTNIEVSGTQIEWTDSALGSEIWTNSTAEAGKYAAFTLTADTTVNVAGTNIVTDAITASGSGTLTLSGSAISLIGPSIVETKSTTANIVVNNTLNFTNGGTISGNVKFDTNSQLNVNGDILSFVGTPFTGTIGTLKISGGNAGVTFKNALGTTSPTTYNISGDIAMTRGSKNSTITIDENVIVSAAKLINAYGYKTLTVNGELNLSEIINASAKASNTITGTGTINTTKLTLGNRGAYVLDGGVRMNIGSGGIEQASSNIWSYSLQIKNATIGASEDWSSDSNIASGKFNLGSGAKFDTNGYTITLNSVISNIGTTGGDVGALTKLGEGTLVLNAANTFSGGVRINAGTVQAGNASALGTGAVKIDGGQLNVASGITLNQTALEIVLSDKYKSGVEGSVAAITGTTGSSIALNGNKITLSRAGEGALTLAAETSLSFSVVDSNLANLFNIDNFKLGTGWDGWTITNYANGVITLSVPEPSAFGLLAGLGALALVGARRRRKTK